MSKKGTPPLLFLRWGASIPYFNLWSIRKRTIPIILYVTTWKEFLITKNSRPCMKSFPPALV
jgi:hypothetical protein